MRIRSLKQALTVNIIVFSIIPIIVFGIITIVFSINSLEEQIYKKNRNLLVAVNQQIEQYFNNAITDMMILKEMIDRQNISGHMLQMSLDNLIREHSILMRILKIEIINRLGVVTSVSPYQREYINLDVSNREFFRRVMETEQIYWSSIFISPQLNKPVVTVAIPLRNGVMAVYFVISDLNTMLEGIEIGRNSFITIIDQTGTYIAHSNKKKALQRDMNPHHHDIIKKSFKNIYSQELIYQNENMLLMANRIQFTEWSVFLYQSLDEIQLPLYKLFAVLLASILITIGFIIIFSTIQSKKFSGQIHDFIDNVKNISKGDYTPLTIEMSIREFEELGTHFNEMIKDIKSREEEKSKSLEEKNVLLQEIHHRVKNNMQIISSLLSLQSHEIKHEEDRVLFVDSQNRIKSMALIHEKMYNSNNFSSIDFNDYINDLIIELISILKIDRKIIKVEIEAKGIFFNLNIAIPCALIINELVSNSFKYAFQESKSGLVKIRLEELDAKTYQLQVADNGIGIPESMDIINTKTLGLQLVNSLVAQMDGQLKFYRDNGTNFIIIFHVKDSLKLQG